MSGFPVRLLIAAVYVTSILIAAKVRARRRRGASFTSGLVVTHEERPGPEFNRYHPVIEVVTIDGEAIRFTSVHGASTMRWPIGMKVDVRVEGEKLEHDDPGYETQGLLFALAFGVFMILFAKNDG